MVSTPVCIGSLWETKTPCVLNKNHPARKSQLACLGLETERLRLPDLRATWPPPGHQAKLDAAARRPGDWSLQAAVVAPGHIRAGLQALCPVGVLTMAFNCALLARSNRSLPHNAESACLASRRILTPLQTQRGGQFWDFCVQ